MSSVAAWSSKRSAPAAVLLLMVFLAGACATPTPTGRFLLHPLPLPDERYRMTAGALVYTDEAVEAEVRPLDQKFVDRNLQAEGRPNPFDLADPSVPAPLIFEIRLKNKGTRALYFNPAQARAVDDRGERYLPLFYQDFYLLYREDPHGRERLETYASICFDRPVELQPGREMKRYLPFASHEEVPKSLTLTLPLMRNGSETYPLFLTFEAFPAE
jgi:hypothetical protein